MKSFYELQKDYINSYEEARQLLAGYGISIEVVDIYTYLIRSPEINEYENLITKQIPAKIIAEIVKYEYEHSPPPEVIEEVKLSESIIPTGIPIFMTNQKIKIKGEIWVVHKNDADPFPSNPHAHNYQNNLVIHLGSGIVYQKRREVGQLETKKLIRLRKEIKYVPLPELTI